MATTLSIAAVAIVLALDFCVFRKLGLWRYFLLVVALLLALNHFA